MSANGWDFGETAAGFPLAWYTPEGHARVTAMQEEYVESGQCARDEAMLSVYAANPTGVLAHALMNDLMSQPTDHYLPLYAERRCLVCGYWRGQHIGLSADDSGMLCPVDASWFQVTATFVPGQEQGRDFNRLRAAGVGE